MQLLKRPYAGRIITGVGLAFAERYNVPVTLVRIVLIASILVSPIMLLAYLLLSISIPDERKHASELRILEPGGTEPRTEFHAIATRMVRRLTPRSARPLGTSFIAILLLALGAFLELPHVEGTSFYWAHPMVTQLAGDLTWVASIASYLSAAAIFLFARSSMAGAVVWSVPARSDFVPDGSRKMIGGVASGLSSVLLLDPAYIRVIWIALNILTLGLAGVLYLLLWYFERSRQRPVHDLEPVLDPGTRPARGLDVNSRIAVTLLLVLLAGIAAATETRWFFFNQQLFEGLVFACIGMLFVWRGLKEGSDQTASLFGTTVFLVGIYFFASALGHFQVSSIDRFEIAEIIGAIGFAYIAFALLTSRARTIALYFAFAIAVGAAMIAFHIAKPEYLTAIIRFYDFFYPIIFAALGIWITFEP